jgi:tetratricopeptide (TPR) repeat protein
LLQTAEERDASVQAYDRLRACFQRPHSRRQQLQLFYALGLTFLRLGETEFAQTTVETALDLADRLPDLAATAELMYLAGSVAYAIGAYKPGADYLTSAGVLLIQLGDEDDPADTALMIDALSTNALCLYTLQAYPAAWAAVMEARLLVARPPGDPLRAGTLALLAALLHRWTGDPARGLQEAMAGAEAYAEWGVTRIQRQYLARLQRVVAECALDLAEASAPHLRGLGRDTYLRIARPAIQRALALARETDDAASLGMALLIRAREQRLRGSQTSRLTTIAAVVKSAEELEDPALAILAYTARGEELAARGEREAALDSFQTANDVSLQYQMPVLGVTARRALGLASEE